MCKEIKFAKNVLNIIKNLLSYVIKKNIKCKIIGSGN